MNNSGFEWSRFVSAPGGVTVDRMMPDFLADRLLVRRVPLSPLRALRIDDEQGRHLASARRRFGLREEVVISGPGPAGETLLRIARDNPRIELEPSFTVHEPTRGSTLGRFEIREPPEASEARYWQILDGAGAVIGRVDDPRSWPQLPSRLDFQSGGSLAIRPVFRLVRPTCSLEFARVRRDPVLRLLAVGLAVLLISVRKTVPPMPGVVSGPG